MRNFLQSLPAVLVLLAASSGAAQTPEPSAAPAPPAVAPTAPAVAPPPPSAIVAPPPAWTPAPPPPPAVDAAPVAPSAPPPPPKTRFELQLDNGSSIRFGVLTQLQYEAFGDFTADDPSNNVAQNLYLRRTMLLIAGTVFHDFDYFVDTDFADLFKAAGEQSLKNGPGISVKDFFATYKPLGEALMIDGGLMLPPLSRNSLQGAPFLNGLDFYTSTYAHAAAFGSSANSFGRDVGLQLRGILPGGRVEYRVGVFQGKRRAPDAEHVASTNGFRTAGRLQFNVLDPEKVYFLRGTWLGEKRLLSFAGSYDFQYSGSESYVGYSFDALLDADNVTAQLEYLYRDGGTRIDLPAQRAFNAEAGYRIPGIDTSPILRLERRSGPDAFVDETLVGGGISLFAFGHNANIKVFYIRGLRDEGPGYDQFKAQGQVFYF